MQSNLILNKNKLLIFHELKKKRIFVGELLYHESSDQFELIYDDKYILLKQAIGFSPKLHLFQKHHFSEKGKLFPPLQDRIPVRENPAYPDYCYSQGISVDETNPIILLGTIGRRGPSSFVFELVYENLFSVADIKNFRKKLEMSQKELALAFGISQVTLQKIEAGESKDPNTLKLIQIYMESPEVALWQLKQRAPYIHRNLLIKLRKYFKQLKDTTGESL